MATIAKEDFQQVIQFAYNSDLKQLSAADGFLAYKVGHNIQVAYPTATTEIYTYRDSSTTLLVITVTYVDASKAAITSVERTA